MSPAAPASRGSANYDVRQNLYIQSSYPLPLGHSVLLRNWTLSGVGLHPHADSL